MKDFISDLLKRLYINFKILANKEENQCRRCGICHHVCQILKYKKSGKIQEE